MTGLIINFASRGRKQQFFQSLENITKTILTTDYKIIASFDYGDVMDSDEVRETIKLLYPKVEIVYGEHTSKVDAINRTSHLFGEFRWLLNHSDDMVYLDRAWDYKMLWQITSVWGDSTDFFAHFSDGFVHDKLPTLNICGYDYYKRSNYIYHPSYGSVSCDAENFFVAKMLGRWHYFPEVYFHHIHPANTPFPVDGTYRGNDKFGSADTKNYFERMSHLFYVDKPVMIPDEIKARSTKKPKLAILIPTIDGREAMLNRLLGTLNKQVAKYKDDVIILINKDNKESTIGTKRNELTEEAIKRGATHRAFIDDDDMVSEDYLDLNMPGVYGNYDCNSLVGIYSVNEVVDPKKHIFLHSLKYDHWWEDDQFYYRNPNHLNVCSLEKIGHIKFQEKNFGEDGCWSEDIAREKCLQKEYDITKPFYHYLFRTKNNGI